MPTTLSASDTSAIEVGLKFQSAINGYVTGIRFYKAPGNLGTHVGNLWTSTGTLLASVTFSNETASGWQYQVLPNPVAISSNTTYVVSYYAPVDGYSVDLGYFAGLGVDSYPLRALADGEDGGNGVYAYGTTSAFPNQTYDAANYWVDVVFAESGGSDTIPPMVCAFSPGAGANGVDISAAATVAFSEAMDASTINASTVTLIDSSSNSVPATVTFNSTTHIASLAPASPLSYGTTYTVTVKGGTGGVADLAENTMSADFVWSFTTLPALPYGGPYGGGPGGPILVLTDPSNAFGTYYAEILLTEGLNEFALRDISSVSNATLAQYDVAILSSIALTPSQVTMLSNWVAAGGNLIAMRPDKQLAGLLGLNDAGSALSEGYLLVNTASGPGAGIVGQTIQFHGTADCYTLDSASSLATLYSNAQTSTVNPAVTLRSVGSNGGQAAAFTFDLARSIVYTRQGNPAWSGQTRDGMSPIRSDDLFYGAASFDPEPSWIDFNKITIPQADEQQRLLANMILSMNSNKRLLPRFWYFPYGYEAVVVMTGDDHGYGGTGGTAGRFDQYIALSPANSSVSNWTAIRGTSYVFPYASLTDAQASNYNAAGFEISLHLNTDCLDYTGESLAALFAQQLNLFGVLYPRLPSPTTHRVHCVTWSSYSTMPQEESLLYGIRLDTSYYYYPSSWVLNRPGLFTGSGMPMRFATAQGSVIDVYQAVTQMTDESGQTYPFTVSALLDKAVGPEGYYGAFVANMHTDLVGSPGSDAILSSALARGVPIISARQLLTWLDARNASAINSITWSNNVQTFSVQANASAKGLQAMVSVPGGFCLSQVEIQWQSDRMFLKRC